MDDDPLTLAEALTVSGLAATPDGDLVEAAMTRERYEELVREVAGGAGIDAAAILDGSLSVDQVLTDAMPLSLGVSGPEACVEIDVIAAWRGGGDVPPWWTGHGSPFTSVATIAAGLPARKLWEEAVLARYTELQQAQYRRARIAALREETR